MQEMGDSPQKNSPCPMDTEIPKNQGTGVKDGALMLASAFC